MLQGLTPQSCHWEGPLPWEGASESSPGWVGFIVQPHCQTHFRQNREYAKLGADAPAPSLGLFNSWVVLLPSFSWLGPAAPDSEMCSLPELFTVREDSAGGGGGRQQAVLQPSHPQLRKSSGSF